MGPRQGHFPKKIPMAALARDAVRVMSLDPNFKPKRSSRFTGVPLQRILDRAGVGPMKGVTVIGRDQYAVYLPASLAANPGVIVAWEREGQPLSAYQGGPMKLLFPPELKMHPSAYCWFVEALIPDYVEQPTVTVRENGKATRYTPSDLDALRPEKRSLFLSIPLGYRRDLSMVAQPSRVTALRLSTLFSERNLAGKRVTLTPFSGRPIALPAAPLLSCEVLLVYRIDDAPIHPALGGPFALFFPVTACRALEGLAPETASLFYLNEISLD